MTLLLIRLMLLNTMTLLLIRLMLLLLMLLLILKRGRHQFIIRCIRCMLSRPRELVAHTANSGLKTGVDSFCTYVSHI